MVEYDGKTYERDSRGKYRCPNRCGHPDYPQPSWVSDKGFLKHLGICIITSVWTPEPVQEREKVMSCPDCEQDMYELTSCWNMGEKKVCLACYLPYYEHGIGFHDCLGIEFPDATLTI